MNISEGQGGIALYHAAALVFAGSAIGAIIITVREWAAYKLYKSYTTAYVLLGMVPVSFLGAWAISHYVLHRPFMLPAYILFVLSAVGLVLALPFLISLGWQALSKRPDDAAKSMLKASAIVASVCCMSLFAIARYWLEMPIMRIIGGVLGWAFVGVIASLIVFFLIGFASELRYGRFSLLALILALIPCSVAYLILCHLYHVNAPEYIAVILRQPALWIMAGGVTFGLVIRHGIIISALPSFRVVNAYCGKCGGFVNQDHVALGRCPHCGVVWTSERNRYHGLSPEEIQRRKVSLANILCALVIIGSCVVAVAELLR